MVMHKRADDEAMETETSNAEGKQPAVEHDATDGGKQPALQHGSNAEGKRPAVEEDFSQAGTPVKKRSRCSAGTDLLAATSDAAELQRGGPVPR